MHADTETTNFTITINPRSIVATCNHCGQQYERRIPRKSTLLEIAGASPAKAKAEADITRHIADRHPRLIDIAFDAI